MTRNESIPQGNESHNGLHKELLTAYWLVTSAAGSEEVAIRRYNRASRLHVALQHKTDEDESGHWVWDLSNIEGSLR